MLSLLVMVMMLREDGSVCAVVETGESVERMKERPLLWEYGYDFMLTHLREKQLNKSQFK